MSWENELYNVYKTQRHIHNDDEVKLLPISHSTANAQIEITITLDGKLRRARALSKDEGARTVIPVTEASAGRTSGACPMPYADKLIYLAGDYEKFTGINNSVHYEVYKKDLQKWAESKYSHPAVKALYNYVVKGTLTADLINAGVLKVDDAEKLTDEKIAGISQADAFIRIVASGDDIANTWEDESLQESFINYYNDIMTDRQLCYVTGNQTHVTYNHPKKIRNTGDQAKLMSTNDESGYTYRGRFKDKSEVVSIAYEFSQGMHNALKWLIARQGINFDGMCLIVWASEMQDVPDIQKEFPSKNKDEELMPPDTRPAYKEELQRAIFSYQAKMTPSTKVMVLALDSATSGRMSVSYYSELFNSEFFSNIEKWHGELSTLRFDKDLKKSYYKSFSLYELLNSAYGNEDDKGILRYSGNDGRDFMLRMIPCIIEGRKMPKDVMNLLYNKASNPLAYDKAYNHSAVVETACGVIQKYYLDHNLIKGGTLMAYEPENRDRSYLYGCLLAVADVAEREAYGADDKSSGRVTNARRYWNAFSKHPFATWRIIEEQLRPYLDGMESQKRIRYEKMLQEIFDKFLDNDFANNSALSPLYLLGFHHYITKIFTPKNNSEE